MRESDENDYTAAGLRDLLNSELAQDAAARRLRREALSKKDAVPARTANREIILALDQGMRAVRAHGLSLFLPKQKIKMFENTFEKLYFADAPSVAGLRRRAIVEDARTKTRRLLLREDMDSSGSVVAPTWHVCADYGSVGFLA